MEGSSARINYNLRPAKHVERKMMCEVFRRLAPFGSVESYRYVGFGSFYYRDFSLFHKSLGISDMLSIEHQEDEEDRRRFRFNLPYSCVRIEFGESTAILPTLTWDVRSIFWLDYDYGLTPGVLADVALFCANACAGSMLVISINAHSETRDKSPTATLKDRLGESAVPVDIIDANFLDWGRAAIYRRVILNAIKEALANRNGVRAPGSKFTFKQLLNFHYRDGAMMLTLGGVLHEQGQAALVASCNFEELPFVCTDDQPYKIEIPRFTYREIRFLDEQLPIAQTSPLRAHGIPANDLASYGRIYRFFPTFTETDVF